MQLKKISKSLIILLIGIALTSAALAQVWYSLDIIGTVTTPIGYDLELRVTTNEVAISPIDFGILTQGQSCIPKDPQTPSDSRYLVYNSGLMEAVTTPNFSGIPTGFTLQIYIDAGLTILWSPGTTKSIQPGNSVTIWIKLTNLNAVYGQTYSINFSFDVVN